MSKRKKNILLSLATLLVGCFMYMFLREDTYVGSIFDGIERFETVRQIFSFQTCALCKFYLPDFLWAFSLGCGLIAIYDPGIKGIIICAGAAFLCGCMWEVLQYSGVLSGTGDIHDSIMYFLASVICITINLKETGEK